MPDCRASTVAGKRLATELLLVVTTAADDLRRGPSPRQQKPPNVHHQLEPPASQCRGLPKSTPRSGPPALKPHTADHRLAKLRTAHGRISNFRSQDCWSNLTPFRAMRLEPPPAWLRFQQIPSLEVSLARYRPPQKAWPFEATTAKSE